MTKEETEKINKVLSKMMLETSVDTIKKELSISSDEELIWLMSALHLDEMRVRFISSLIQQEIGRRDFIEEMKKADKSGTN